MTLPYHEIVEKFFQAERIEDFSLYNTEKACRYFSNPEKSFQSIHVAGTNGKGSVAKMTFQILKDAGKKVGVYTSPHLVEIRERFETEKGRISEEDFARYATMIIEYGGNLSYFERCAVLAFLYFRDQKVEYAVIEVGLGGRLDATNVITPIISAITSIGYDHMEFLGETLEEIASEKGGIIKEGIPVVLYAQNPTLERIAQEKNAPIIFPREGTEITTNLLGNHQMRNARIAYEIGAYLGIDTPTIERALLHVDHSGRIQYLTPNLLIDGAHNEEGLRMLRAYLEDTKKRFSEKKMHLCFGLKAGKNANLVIEIFPEEKEWILLRGKNPLLAYPEALQREIREKGKSAEILSKGELLVRTESEKETLFIVFGSLYLLGEFLENQEIFT